MRATLRFLVGGLSALALSLGANAQPGPGMQGGMGGMTGMGGMGGMSSAAKPAAGECAKARDPQRCEALQKAKDMCKDKAGPDKRKCMTEAMPPMDCSKARNPARCEAHQKAKEACKDKAGRDHRQCIREQTRAGGRTGNQPATPTK